MQERLPKLDMDSSYTFGQVLPGRRAEIQEVFVVSDFTGRSQGGKAAKRLPFLFKY